MKRKIITEAEFIVRMHHLSHLLYGNPVIDFLDDKYYDYIFSSLWEIATRFRGDAGQNYWKIRYLTEQYGKDNFYNKCEFLYGILDLQ